MDLQATFMQCGSRQKVPMTELSTLTKTTLSLKSHKVSCTCSLQQRPPAALPRARPSALKQGHQPRHCSKSPLVPCCCVHLARPWQGHQTQGAGRGISEARVCCRAWHYCNLWLAYHHQNNKIKVVYKKKTFLTVGVQRLNLILTQ